MKVTAGLPEPTPDPKGELMCTLQDCCLSLKLNTQRHTVVLDCGAVPEPNAVEDRIHSGLHPAFVSMYSKSKALNPFLEQAFQSVTQGIGNKSAYFRFTCADAKGCYASLVLAKILAEIADADRYVTLNRIIMLSRRGDFDCSPCDRCASFRDRRWIEKNAALAAELQKWQSLLQTGFIS